MFRDNLCRGGGTLDTLEYRKEVEVLSALFVVLLSMQIKCINLLASLINTIPYPFIQLYDDDIDWERERDRHIDLEHITHRGRRIVATTRRTKTLNTAWKMHSQSCCWLLPLAFGKYKSNRSKSTELPVSNRYTRTRDSINSFSPLDAAAQPEQGRVACMLHVGDFWLQIMQPPPG